MNLKTRDVIENLNGTHKPLYITKSYTKKLKLVDFSNPIHMGMIIW